MVRGVVVVDNRGCRWIAALVILASLLAVPAGIYLRVTFLSGDGDRRAIERIRCSLRAENDRRISEVAKIRHQDFGG